VRRKMKLVRKIAVSRYTHLCMGLILIYGLSLAVTYTSRFEKILDSLRWYAYADYFARDSCSTTEALVCEFYKERYKERLSSLTAGLFDYQDHKQLQAFLLVKGFVYEVWQENDGGSYLLAPILERGEHIAAVPEKVAFDYYILGSKKIAPWPEHRFGHRAGAFVSAGEEGVYIHRDNLDHVLRTYFDILWDSEVRLARDFEWNSLTCSLHRDLRSVCEDVLTYRHYRSKTAARDYFVEEGFNVFMPTMLAMGARMVVDRNSQLSSAYRYQRAYLTGLYLEPNYTMVSLLGYQSAEHNQPAIELWKEFNRRLNMAYPDGITLDQISEAAREIFERLEEGSRS